MTQQIALNELTNDLIFKEGGGIERVKDGRYTIQVVRSKLQTILGEWLLSPSVGWLNLDDFIKNPDLFDIEMRAKEVILSCKGVQVVDSMTLTLENRVLNIQFTAKTIYGVISLTVPWRL